MVLPGLAMRTCFQPYRNWCAAPGKETAARAAGRASLEKNLLAYDKVGPSGSVDYKDVVGLRYARFIATWLYLSIILFLS